MRTRKAVGALIINENNELLLVQKVKIMDGSTSSVPVDEWDFVKGGIKKMRTYKKHCIENL